MAVYPFQGVIIHPTELITLWASHSYAGLVVNVDVYSLVLLTNHQVLNEPWRV
jgi:hypothetical protein